MRERSKKPLSLTEFRSIYSKVNRLNVELIITSEKGILLTLRSIEPYLNEWHVPGGTVYSRERLVEAVKRIAWE